MTLGEKQELFLELLGQFIPPALAWARAEGYSLRPRELGRSDEQAEIHALGKTGRAELVHYLRKAGVWETLAAAIENNVGSGIRQSVHRLFLAQDLIMVKAGQVVNDSALYAPLGEIWKKLHPLCRWGGDFGSPDGGHFSLEHNGVK